MTRRAICSVRMEEASYTPSRANSPKYQLLMELGKGGMGVVHLAMSRGPQGFTKLLVLKIMRRELLGEPEPLQMFLEEARISARLAHPNIVHVFEVGEHEGCPCIVMEYLEGQPLSSMLVRAPEKPPLPLHLQVLAQGAGGPARRARAARLRRHVAEAGSPRRLAAQRVRALRRPGQGARLRHRQGGRLRDRDAHRQPQGEDPVHVARAADPRSARSPRRRLFRRRADVGGAGAPAHVGRDGRGRGDARPPQSQDPAAARGQSHPRRAARDLRARAGARSRRSLSDAPRRSSATSRSICKACPSRAAPRSWARSCARSSASCARRPRSSSTFTSSRRSRARARRATRRTRRRTDPPSHATPAHRREPDPRGGAAVAAAMSIDGATGEALTRAYPPPAAAALDPSAVTVTPTPAQPSRHWNRLVVVGAIGGLLAFLLAGASFLRGGTIHAEAKRADEAAAALGPASPAPVPTVRARLQAVRQRVRVDRSPRLRLRRRELPVVPRVQRHRALQPEARVRSRDLLPVVRRLRRRLSQRMRDRSAHRSRSLRLLLAQVPGAGARAARVRRHLHDLALRKRLRRLQRRGGRRLRDQHPDRRRDTAGIAASPAGPGQKCRHGECAR